MPGMFQGSSGQNATTTSNSNSSTNYTPQYNSYVDNILSTAQSLGAQPFQPGPTAQNRFAPATPAMQTGWGNIMGNAANYMPAQNMAMAGLNTASQTPNAWTAGAPALGAAAMQPGGYQAAQPWMQAASQTWPSASSQYVNPFLSGAIGYGNQLATQNLMERTLPGVMDQFVTSGGQLGRQNYNNQLSRTLRDFGNTAYGNAMNATSNNYNQLNQQFQGDQNRLASLGQTAGGLANQTMGQFGQLAQTAGGLANMGSQQGLNLAQTGMGAAQTASGLGLTNAGAQVNVGQQQQALDQQQRDYAEQQRQAAIQWPYQMVNFMRDAQSGLQIPTTQTAQSTSSSNTANNGSTSPFGSILGGLTAVSSMGGSGGMGSVLGGLGNLFGGGQSGGYTLAGGSPGSIAGQATQLPGGIYNQAKRGGHFAKLERAKKFAAGGHAPVVKAMSQNTKRSQQGALSRRRAAEQEKAPHGAFSGRPPPKMPPIMPMAPPAGGPPMGGPPRPPMPAMKRGGYFAGSQTRGR